MAQFTGVLNSNVIFAALFNMIISQQVMANNIEDGYTEFLDKSRTEGSMYGDTKIYYATDAYHSRPWGADAEATNLLKINRPDAPKQQKIVLDTFRQVDITIDNYLTKQAWATEGAFASFNSVILAWLRDTKDIYDQTTFNTYIGTTKSTIDDIEVKEADYPTLGQGIGLVIANLFVDLRDTTRKFNDYGFMRSYKESSINVVWNAKFVNQVMKIDLPVLFHKEGLIGKFSQYILPAHYFGNANTVTKTTADDNTYSMEEQEVTLAGGTKKWFFAGEQIPSGTTLVSSGSIIVKTYQIDDNAICKVMHTDSVPFMSGFEVGTSFFNPRSLTENHYLTWGHNTLQYLQDKPFLTLVLTPKAG